MSEEKEKVSLLNVDWFLQDLIRAAEVTGETAGITLNVKGVLISGNLISVFEYFRLAGELLEKVRKEAGRLSEEGEGGFFVISKEMKEIREKGEASQIGFIHLKDAKIFMNPGCPLPTESTVLWRGILDSVDGFIWGTMSAEKSKGDGQAIIGR